MKKITVAVCVDEKGGMLLFGRRQSRDRVLIADFLSSAGEGTVHITPFSEKLFNDANNVKVSNAPILAAGDGDFVFIEDMALSGIIDNVSTLIIYNWNRHYPSDVKIDIDPTSSGFTLVESYDFEGSSHERITKETYRRV